MKNHHPKGFTLIELLIVIGLIAVIAGVVIVLLNPARQFANARNSSRWSHISALLGNIQTNAAENRGTFTCAAGIIPTSTTAISAAGYDLCDCVVPTYAAALPFDPSAAGAGYTDCNTYYTGYSISRNPTTGQITIAAPAAELTQTISVTQ